MSLALRTLLFAAFVLASFVNVYKIHEVSNVRNDAILADLFRSTVACGNNCNKYPVKIAWDYLSDGRMSDELLFTGREVAILTVAAPLWWLAGRSRLGAPLGANL